MDGSTHHGVDKGENTNRPPKPPYPEEPDGSEDTDNQEPEGIIDKQGPDDGSGNKNDETDAAGESDDTSEEDNESDYSVCLSQSERDMGSWVITHTVLTWLSAKIVFSENMIISNPG